MKSWQNNVSAELYILWYGGKLREYINVCCAHLQTQHLLLFGNVGFGVSHYQELWRSLKVSLEWELEFKRLTLNQPRLEHIMGSSSSEVPWAPSWSLLSCPRPGSAVGFGVPLQVAFRALCVAPLLLTPLPIFDATSWIVGETWHLRAFRFHPCWVPFPLELIDEGNTQS